MANILNYKGYYTKIEFDVETGTLRGVIEGINDFVDFSTDNLHKIEEEFHIAVDDYLAFCEDIGVSPDKSYKGSFNVRMRPELHRELAIKAFHDNCSLNEEVERAVEAYLNKDDTTQTLEDSVRDLTEAIRTQITENISDFEDETDTSQGCNIISFTKSKFANKTFVLEN